MITAIAAVNEIWGIGRSGGLLFDIPEDMKHFRRATIGHTVIMGRKTLESLPNGKPFKDRRNIVLTKNADYRCEGAEVCHTIEEALALVKDGEEVFICGGSEVYKEFLPFCSKALVTKVRAMYPADTFFPNLDTTQGWELSEQTEEHEFEGLKYKFCTYIKK